MPQTPRRRSPEHAAALKQLGQNVRILRVKAGNIPVDEFGRRIGMPGPQISRIERGETNPGAISLLRIAAGFGVSVGDLFDGVSLEE